MPKMTRNRIIAISIFNGEDATKNKLTFGILKNDTLYLNKNERVIIMMAYNILSGKQTYELHDRILETANNIVKRTYSIF